MKFYLDENLPKQIAERLRQRGFDAVSAQEVGNRRISDREQLAYATAEGRCLVTKNIAHFIGLSRNAIARRQSHAGIILCPQSLVGSEIETIADRLIEIAERYPKGLGGFDVLYL